VQAEEGQWEEGLAKGEGLYKRERAVQADERAV